MFKMDKWYKKILFMAVALAINTAGWFLSRFFDLPALLNQGMTLAVAYYLGPVYGMITALITGGIGALIDPVSLVILPGQLAVTFLVGFIAKREKFLDNLFHSVSIACLLGFTQGIIMAIIFGIFRGSLESLWYSRAITRMLATNNFPTPFRFFVAGTFTVYPDCLLSIACLWLNHFIRTPLKKKRNRKAFLKRNTAALAGLVLAVGTVVGFLPANAASASQSAQYTHKIYNQENGLISGTANDIVQTDDGTMWIGTYGGLYRFNGEEFTRIDDIQDVRSVVSLFVDSLGEMWICNNGTGLAITTSDRGVINMNAENGLPSNFIRCVQEINSDKFYVATNTEVVIVERGDEGLQITGTLEGVSNVRNMYVDSRGNVFAYESDDEVQYLVNDEVVYEYGESLDLNANCVSGDADNDEVFIGSSDGSVTVLTWNGSEYLFTATYETDEIGSINDIYRDDEGLLFVAGDQGLGYFNEDQEFTQIYVQGFTTSVEHILEDYQGNLWFTSSRCGLLCLMQSPFYEPFTACGVDSVVVNAVCIYDDLLYVGCDDGLVILDEATGTRVENSITETMAGLRIRDFCEDTEGNLWIATYTAGAYIVMAGSEECISKSWPSDLGKKVRMIEQLSDGTMAVSTTVGFSLFTDPWEATTFFLEKGDIGSMVLTCEELDDGLIAAGTDGDGLYLIDGDEIVEHLTRREGLVSEVILRIADDPVGEGTFILTGAGMCYMNADHSIYEITGFPYFNNLDIVFGGDDENPRVFVASTAGLYVTSYHSLMNDESVDATLIDMTKGLPGSLTSNSWNAIDEEGILYLCGTTGVYAVDTEHYEVDVLEYKPIVAKVRLDGAEQVTSNVETLEIDSDVSEVVLCIELNNYTTSDPVIVYWLDGGNDDTKTTCLSSELKDIYYRNLPSGTSKFHIRVLDSEEETVLTEKVFTIVKIAEDYESVGFIIYFYVSMAAILLTMACAITNIATYSLSRRQKEQYEKRLAVLEREKSEALEIALHQEESANRSKSDFLASMSHEIRTPINAILGMDTMILRESTQPMVKKYAKDVESAGKTLLALINDILDFSKIESGKMELVLGDYELSSVINDLINMVRPKTEAKDLELEVSVNPKIPAQLYGDEVRVKQIILNILNNAVKYTEKGKVSLSIDYESVSADQIALKVSVADTGIGIKEEDLKKLFSPYERIEENRNKNVEGTGLGMAITKTLLELMNSQLLVESVYGQGSTFSFTILQKVRSQEEIGDFEARLNSANKDNADVESYHAPDAKILVVDDVEMNLIVATSLMKRIQVQVTTSTNGREAIRLAKENAYDIIFLDAMMPEMSGEETLKHIREECEINRETPTIVLTANAIKGAREEYLAVGFDNYLSKPIESRKLEAMIQCYLPDDKILPPDASPAAEETGEDAGGENAQSDELLQKIGSIPGIELQRGIETAGGEDIYRVVCKNFYDTAAERIEMLEKHYSEHDVKNYTIQVHALKSSARLIGAYRLSEKAWDMEQAGRAEDWEAIEEHTDKLIAQYRDLLIELDEVYDTGEEDEGKLPMSESELRQNLSDMRELLDAFDFDTAKDLYESLGDYKLPDHFKEYGKKIRGKIAEVDRDGIMALIDEYLTEGK